MSTTTRPRLEEFLLAVLWTISAPIWGYFGFIGYVANLFGPDEFSLPRFTLSYFFLCMTVFGLRFALNVFLRIPKALPRWVDNFAPLVLGFTLLAGFLFSITSLIIMVLDLLRQATNNIILAWGFAAAAGVLLMAMLQLLSAVHVLEPFLIWLENRDGHKVPWLLRWVVWLNLAQRTLSGSGRNKRQSDRRLRGPLLTETDLKTTVIEEKPGGRPGLEKTMIAHGGWHVTTLGFAANASVIFAASNGRVPHFQAGGRRGMIFPPEIKFWEWHTGRVQTASLGQVQNFLTRNSEIPTNLQGSRFVIPAGGGKFAWVTNNQIRIGDWQSDEVLTLSPEEGVALDGFGGFNTLSFNPEGTKFGWCDAAGQPRYWDLESNRTLNLREYPDCPAGSITGTEQGLWGLLFSPDGTKVAVLGVRGVLLQNVFTGWRWFAENNPTIEKLTAFGFDHNGFEMAIGLMAQPSAIRMPQRRGRTTGQLVPPTEGWTPIVRLWDLRAGDFVDLIAGSSPVRELAFSPDNRLLVAVDEEGILRLWSIVPENSSYQLPRQVAQLDLGITGRKTLVAFSPDMERLICATDNRILIWNMAKIRQEWTEMARTAQA